MKCGCGEEVSGTVCMLCGSEVAQEAAPDTAVAQDMPNAAAQGDAVARGSSAARGTGGAGEADAAASDSLRTGRLGDYLLDIENAVRIMDRNGNRIYDIPFDDITCSNRFGALRMQHPGGRISVRGQGGRAWRRAISYQQSPPVWYLTGAEDCLVSYAGAVLGVTPCVVVPPFSWDAFHAGAYELRISRPGGGHKTVKIRAASGVHQIRFPAGEAAERSGGAPEGETLVLNGTRSLVMSDVPYLTDRRGVEVLRMPGAAVKVWFLKRGATIYWDGPGIGRLSISVKCDSKLKYDRLREMLPPAVSGVSAPEAPPAAEPSAEPPHAEQPVERPPVEQPVEPQAAEPDTATYNVDVPKPTTKKWWQRTKGGGKPGKSRWGWRKKKGKYNRGVYEGTDLTVTKNDLDTKLGRFDGYSFEALCANLLAAMGYKIVKGYDVKSGRMLGPTKGDKGIDVIAEKDKERIIVQCKMWQGAVGGPDVNKTLGAATTEKGTSVLMISTGGFHAQASQIARESSMKVELWDWDVVRRNMRRHLL